MNFINQLLENLKKGKSIFHLEIIFCTNTTQDLRIIIQQNSGFDNGLCAIMIQYTKK